MLQKMRWACGAIALIVCWCAMSASASAQPAINGPTPPRFVPMTAPEEKNLALVLRWYREVIEGGHLELAPRYQAASYIQHNPNVNTGLNGFLEAFSRDNAPVNPIPAQLENPPPLAGARGDFVWILWQRRPRDLAPATPFYYHYRFELLRVEHNQVQEHWDAAQKYANTGKVLFGKSSQPLRRFDTGKPSAAERGARDIAIEAATQVYFHCHFELADRLFSADYIEHDPNLPYEPTLRKRLAAYESPHELETDEPAIALVNGELVVMMWNVSSADPDDGSRTYPWNYFHLMRVRHGRVVEHWDPDALRTSRGAAAAAIAGALQRQAGRDCHPRADR